MGDHLRLFPVEHPASDDTAASLTVRRTARALALIGNGKHPATGRCLLRIQDPTLNRLCCGDCAHLASRLPGNRVYWKCDVHPKGVTGGPLTDIRLSWPACVLFERASSSAPGIQRSRYPAPVPG